MITKTIQVFRHRGYQPADPAAEIVMQFGDGPDPLNPDGTVMKKIWDHDHEQHTTVSNHVEPVPVTTQVVTDPAPTA